MFCVFLAALLLLLSLSACKEKRDPNVPIFTYTEEGTTPAKIIGEGDHWYAITNTYGLADFCFVAGDSYDTMEPVYQTPNGGYLRNLTAEGPLCAFFEKGVQSLRYALYNAEDGSVTDMYTADELSNQNGNMVFVNGCVYFGVIDYENSAGMLKCYDIAAGTLTDFCPLPYAEIDTVQALSRDGDDVLVTVKAKEDQRSQIYRLSTIDGSREILELPQNVHTVYSASYDPSQNAYIVYYQDGNDRSESIGIFCAEENAITPVYTFEEGCYAYFDTVECRDGKIYWCLQDNPTGSFTDKYELLIYDCEDEAFVQYPQGYSFTLNEESFFCLTLEEGTPLKISLYERPYK